MVEGEVGTAIIDPIVRDQHHFTMIMSLREDRNLVLIESEAVYLLERCHLVHSLEVEGASAIIGMQETLLPE